jgi:hypothetical protein
MKTAGSVNRTNDVSCVSPCLFKGFEPSKKPWPPLLDLGEWKEKVCEGIGPMCWSREKKKSCHCATIFMEMEKDRQFINFNRKRTGQKLLASIK